MLTLINFRLIFASILTTTTIITKHNLTKQPIDILTKTEHSTYMTPTTYTRQYTPDRNTWQPQYYKHTWQKTCPCYFCTIVKTTFKGNFKIIYSFPQSWISYFPRDLDICFTILLMSSFLLHPKMFIYLSILFVKAFSLILSSYK